MNLQEDLIDVFDNITQFLDYESLCKLACVSKTCNEVAKKELKKRYVWVIYFNNKLRNNYYIFHGSYQQAINQSLILHMNITDEEDGGFCKFSVFLEKFNLERTIRNFLFWEGLFSFILESEDERNERIYWDGGPDEDEKDILYYIELYIHSNAKAIFFDGNEEYINNFNSIANNYLYSRHLGTLESAAQEVINHVFSDKNIAIYINEYIMLKAIGILTLDEFKKGKYWPPVDNRDRYSRKVYLLEKDSEFSNDLVVEEIPDFEDTLPIANPSDYNVTPAKI